MTRDEVYNLIDKETGYLSHVREYEPDRVPVVSDWLMRIKHEAAGFIHSTDSIDHIIRLAGFCVACMEGHGAIRREDSMFLYPLSRDGVYGIIDGERAYQNALPPSRTDGSTKMISGYAAMIDHYTRAAIDGWVTDNTDWKALDNVRKIAGICVRCLEEHAVTT